jgi:hypothetical protein
MLVLWQSLTSVCTGLYRISTLYCSKTIFIAPVTEIEVEQTIKGLKNLAAGFVEIPVSLVKQCLGYC